MSTEVRAGNAEVVSGPNVARTQRQSSMVRTDRLLASLAVSQRCTELVPQQRVLQAKQQDRPYARASTG